MNTHRNAGSLNAPHLSESQLEEALFPGEHGPSPAVAAHLNACADCRREVAGLGASLQSFRSATADFAAGHAPPLAIRGAVPATGSGRAKWLAWGAAWPVSLATAALLAVTTVTVLRPHPAAPAHPGAPQTRKAQAADPDAALMDQIAADVSASVPPSLEPLNVPAESQRPRAAGAR